MLQKLFGVFLFGIIFLNYPVMSLFSENSWFVDIPKLYLFVYAIWFLLIMLSAWVIEKNSFQNRKPGSDWKK